MIAEVADVKCLSQSSLNNDLITRVGIKVEGATHEEMKQLSQFIQSLIELTNEQQAIHLLSGLKVVFKDILGDTSVGSCLPAHQLVRNQIHIGRFCKSSKGKKLVIPYREGILIHEMGHFVANKHGFYGQYKASVKRKCKLSPYMSKMSNGKKHRNRNEEFAEVFASYFLYGKKLRRKCRKSYAFFKERLFLDNNSNCL